MVENILSQPGREWLFRNQNLSLLTQAVTVKVHRHRCFQVVIGLTGTFDCTLAGTSLDGLRGLIVNQNIPHACLVHPGDVLVNFIASDSYWGRQLRSKMNQQAYINLADLWESEAEMAAAYASLLPSGYVNLPNEELIPYIDSFFEQVLHQLSPDNLLNLGAGKTDAVKTDERIHFAIAYIDQHLGERLLVEDIADQIFLSPARARHLFAYETGTPFSQYVLWKRIKAILQEVITGQRTMADACLKYGFVDQPHFNRTFTQIFGTNPNTMVKGGRLIC